MTDSEVLKELIKTKGLKFKYIAKCLGLSYYGLKLKISNSQEFKTSEVVTLCEILGIDSLSEKEAIFLRKMMI